MKGRDQASTDFLALAFDEAVSFFGYNANVKGLKQFRSVEDYLSKVGTENAFELLGYRGNRQRGKSNPVHLPSYTQRNALHSLVPFQTRTPGNGISPS